MVKQNGVFSRLLVKVFYKALRDNYNLASVVGIRLIIPEVVYIDPQESISTCRGSMVMKKIFSKFSSNLLWRKTFENLWFRFGRLARDVT